MTVLSISFKRGFWNQKPTFVLRSLCAAANLLHCDRHNGLSGLPHLHGLGRQLQLIAHLFENARSVLVCVLVSHDRRSFRSASRAKLRALDLQTLRVFIHILLSSLVYTLYGNAGIFMSTDFCTNYCYITQAILYTLYKALDGNEFDQYTSAVIGKYFDVRMPPH
ncbi:hypothetical protein RR46_14786 [Papilio xuthus]|uniref:Uncharacterized protein n=1 Tax=Papilio xuthus TaxID=66420 RepID=A0A194PDF7_PAPXU|nr:hypothetical protein RR46_14786 [Papilio xuthus]